MFSQVEKKIELRWRQIFNMRSTRKRRGYGPENVRQRIRKMERKK